MSSTQGGLRWRLVFGGFVGGVVGLLVGVFVAPFAIIPFLDPQPLGLEALVAIVFTAPVGLAVGIWVGVRLTHPDWENRVSGREAGREWMEQEAREVWEGRVDAVPPREDTDPIDSESS